jgi:hypothetical protein
MRIVFKVELADAILAQAADLLHNIETGLGRIADIVITPNNSLAFSGSGSTPSSRRK